MIAEECFLSGSVIVIESSIASKQRRHIGKLPGHVSHLAGGEAG